MPRTYKKKRVQRRGRTYRGGRRGKKYQRKRKMNHPTSNVQRTIGFADKQYVKLRQVYNAGIIGGVANSTYYVVPNLLYSPLSPGFSNTDFPQGFNTWALLYSKYIVKACAIKVRCLTLLSPAGDPTDPVVFTVWASSVIPDTTSPDNYVLLAGQPYAKQRTIGVATGGHDLCTIKHYIGTQKILGFDYLDISELYGSTLFPGTPSPQQNWYYGINIQSATGENNIRVQLTLDITYYTEFFDRLDTSYA